MAVLNSYQAIEKYLNSFILYSSLRLDRIKNLLRLLGNPQDKFDSIIVGGTAGKGSTATLLASILQAADAKVGLFTSPHLVKINERFVINGRQITDQELIDLVNKIKAVLMSLRGSRAESRETKQSQGLLRSARNDMTPSYFEILTTLAFLWFAQEKIKVAVLEVGMGGRVDATNIVHNKIAVLTNVGLDHTQFLGKTVAKIAKEKVAIVKKNGVLITGVTQPSVVKVVKEYVKKQQSKAIFVLDKKCEVRNGMLEIEMGNFDILNKRNVSIKSKNQEYLTSVSKTSHLSLLTSKHGSIFNLKTPFHQYQNLHVSLLGPHQITNATLAVTAAETYQPKISQHAIREGLAKAFIAGRLELVKLNKADRAGPRLILDGAHNPMKIKALVQTLKILWPGKKFITVLAVKKTKDVKGMLKILLPVISQLVVTKFVLTTDTGRFMATPPKIIRQIAREIDPQKKIMMVPQAAKTLQKALLLAKKDDLILVTGSLYLVGEIRKFVF